jgi:steroid 5-alpha reductase family enzyme
VHTGLWAYSRHPNFISEQLVWVTVYSFSAIANQKLLNPSVVGPILLILLFVGSTNFTEEITASKYPEYKHYQQHVAMWIPLPWASPYKPKK